MSKVMIPCLFLLAVALMSVAGASAIYALAPACSGSGVMILCRGSNVALVLPQCPAKYESVFRDSTSRWTCAKDFVDPQ